MVIHDPESRKCWMRIGSGTIVVINACSNPSQMSLLMEQAGQAPTPARRVLHEVGFRPIAVRPRATAKKQIKMVLEASASREDVRFPREQLDVAKRRPMFPLHFPACEAVWRTSLHATMSSCAWLELELVSEISSNDRGVLTTAGISSNVLQQRLEHWILRGRTSDDW